MIDRRAANPPHGMSGNDMVASLQRSDIKSLYLGDSFGITEFLEIAPPFQLSDSYDLILIDLSTLPNQYIQQILDACDSTNVASLGILSTENVERVDINLEITDFIMYPVNEHELHMRAKRALRRSVPSMGEDVVVRDDLVINPTNYEVTISGKRINLRFKEYELLLKLASNPGRVYDRATLLNQIWGYDYFGGTRTVDVHIRRLRSKIENDIDNKYIETIWNVGYRFKPMD